MVTKLSTLFKTLLLCSLYYVHTCIHHVHTSIHHLIICNSLLNYSVQTLSPRHHRLATTVFYSGSHQLVHLEHKELERTDVKKRKTMLSETTNLAGLAWPSITTQMHHYSFKFFHAGTFDQSSTPSEMQHVKIFTSVRSITAQSVTNSRWP